MVQARATHGTFRDCYYYEVKVTHLGSSGHARIGWATRKGELQAPVRLQTPMQRALPCLHAPPKLHASTCMQAFTRKSSQLDAKRSCSVVLLMYVLQYLFSVNAAGGLRCSQLRISGFRGQQGPQVAAGGLWGVLWRGCWLPLSACMLETVLLVMAGLADRCPFPPQGDVIGCLLYMPEGGRTFEKDKSVRVPTFSCAKDTVVLVVPLQLSLPEAKAETQAWARRWAGRV